jgi:hypothetical protein
MEKKLGQIIRIFFKKYHFVFFLVIIFRLLHKHVDESLLHNYEFTPTELISFLGEHII